MTRPLLFPTYPQYKPSRIPWLDEIPAHWEMRRLKFSATNVTKLTSQRNEDDLTLALENVESWSGKYADAGPDVQFDSQLKRFQSRDVLFGKLRPYLAKVVLPDRHGLCVGEFLVLRSREDILFPEYLWMLLRSPTVVDVISASSFGAKMPRTDWRFVGGMRLPLPPLHEQATIARYLTHKDAHIQRYLHTQRRLLASLQQLRKSTIHYTVIHGLDPKNTSTKPSGIPWLGDIPAHWQTPRLKYLCSRSGIYGANIPATEYQDTGIRFIRTTDITDEGILKDSGGVFLPKELVDNYLLDDGDILISRSGTVGRSFLYQSKLHGLCAHACYLVRFVPGPRILPEYLFQFTQTQAFQGFLRSVVIQSTIENVNAKKYSNAHIPLPPLDEQAAIAEYLDERIAKIDAAIAGASRLIDLMEQYRASLIHEVVTGARDVRKAAAVIRDD